MSTDVQPPADRPLEPVQPGHERSLAAQASPEFAALRRSFRSFVFPMTAAFLAWYLLYVLLSAFARDFMGAKIVGNINVALVFGLLQFVSTFLIAWLYSRYARTNLDPAAERIRAELEAPATVGPSGPSGPSGPAGPTGPTEPAGPLDEEDDR
jgi:uncharacterized membrane protein (DUF485 family)